MTRDAFRNSLGAFLTTSFVGTLVGLFALPIPVANKDLVVFMLGQLSGFVGAVLAFNFGTTKSSADKNAVIANLQTSDAATGKPGDPFHTQEDPPLDLGGMEQP